MAGCACVGCWMRLLPAKGADVVCWMRLVPAKGAGIGWQMLLLPAQGAGIGWQMMLLPAQGAGIGWQMMMLPGLVRRSCKSPRARILVLGTSGAHWPARWPRFELTERVAKS